MKEIELSRDLVARGFGYDELARMTRRGEIVRVRRGAYGRPEGGLDDRRTHLRLVRATIDGCALTTVLSHQSAAAVHGLPLWTDELSRVHVVRPAGRGKVRRYVHLHPAALAEHEIEVVGGMVVTSVARTVVDLARSRPLVRSVPVGDAALARGLAADDLAAAIRRATGWPGIARARRAAGLMDGGSESVGESVSRVILIENGAPRPALQYEVRNERGETVGIADFGWEAERTLGEFDGKIKYGRLLKPGESATDVVYAEKRREDALRDLGWQVVRWSWDDLRHPDKLLARIRRAFTRR